MNMYLVFALLSALFAALVTIIAKLALQNIEPTLLTSVRAVIMALLLIVLSLFEGDLYNVLRFTSKDWLFVTLAALFGALSWLFYFVALKLAPNVKGVYAIDRFSVVLVVFLAWLILHETLTWRAVVGSLLVFFGVLLMN